MAQKVNQLDQGGGPREITKPVKGKGGKPSKGIAVGTVEMTGKKSGAALPPAILEYLQKYDPYKDGLPFSGDLIMNLIQSGIHQEKNGMFEDGSPDLGQLNRTGTYQSREYRQPPPSGPFPPQQQPVPAPTPTPQGTPESFTQLLAALLGGSRG